MEAQHALASDEALQHTAYLAAQRDNAATLHQFRINAEKEINAARQTAIALSAQVAQLERDKVAMSRLPSPRTQHFDIGDDL